MGDDRERGGRTKGIEREGDDRDREVKAKKYNLHVQKFESESAQECSDTNSINILLMETRYKITVRHINLIDIYCINRNKYN